MLLLLNKFHSIIYKAFLPILGGNFFNLIYSTYIRILGDKKKLEGVVRDPLPLNYEDRFKPSQFILKTIYMAPNNYLASLSMLK